MREIERESERERVRERERMKIMQEGSNGCRSDGNCFKFVVLFFNTFFASSLGS